jgi:hypothetical protein
MDSGGRNHSLARLGEAGTTRKKKDVDVDREGSNPLKEISPIKHASIVNENRHENKNMSLINATSFNSVGYCLSCGARLSKCGLPFTAELRCRCGAINIYEESQQPKRFKDAM